MIFGLRGMLVAGIIGTLFGGFLGWNMQSAQIEKAETKLTNIAIEGARAQKNAMFWEKKSEEIKKVSDEKYENDMGILRRDIERLRLTARGHILPSASPTARSPEKACLDRAEFEQAFGRLVEELQGIVTEGDEGIVGLNAAKVWAREVEVSAMPP